jgi:hypothetical protein
VEGEYVDDKYTEGLDGIFGLLWKSKEKFLVERYGLWLVKRDPRLGLKVCPTFVTFACLS